MKERRLGTAPRGAPAPAFSAGGAAGDPTWGGWSADALARAADESVLVINPIVFAEVSVWASGTSSASADRVWPSSVGRGPWVIQDLRGSISQPVSVLRAMALPPRQSSLHSTYTRFPSTALRSVTMRSG